MGGRAPHLGLALTEGSVDGYSIEDRDQITLSNTRGSFLLHPAIETLAPGETQAVAWTLFWHRGWADFFGQARQRSPQMVQIDASSWTARPGEPVTMTFAGELGDSPTLTVGESTVDLNRSATGWTATLPGARPGELRVTLRYGDGLSTSALLNTAPDLDELVAQRVRFITERQQWHKRGDP